MPVVSMNCPVCGKQATEYDENKWQCLYCGGKFRYERPMAPREVPAVTINKGGKAVADGFLFDEQGIKVSARVLSAPGGKVWPIGSILGVQQTVEYGGVKPYQLMTESDRVAQESKILYYLVIVSCLVGAVWLPVFVFGSDLGIVDTYKGLVVLSGLAVPVSGIVWAFYKLIKISERVSTDIYKTVIDLPGTNYTVTFYSKSEHERFSQAITTAMSTLS